MIRNCLYVWVWQDVVRNITKQNELFTVCQVDGIGRVLCAFYDAFVAGNEFSLVARFIANAHSLGIEVFGIPSVFATDLATPTNTKPQIVNMLNYNRANPAAMFDGVAFDVESPGWGVTACNIYTNYFRTIKGFYNSAVDTLISQDMKFSAYLDPPYYLAGTPYGNTPGVNAAITIYRELDEVEIVGYEINKPDLISHLKDAPAVCQANGIVFRCGFELSQLGYYGEIGPLGYDYYKQFSADMDSYFASYSYYGGRYVEQYSSLEVLMNNVFGPGQAKTATVSVILTPANLAATLELYLGTSPSVKVATSGKIPFTSTGVAQTVTCPITMPNASGQYHVYIDMMMGSNLIVGFIATDDVIIPAGSIQPPVWN